jgi:hypothetical protein
LSARMNRVLYPKNGNHFSGVRDLQLFTPEIVDLSDTNYEVLKCREISENTRAKLRFV